MWKLYGVCIKGCVEFVRIMPVLVWRLFAEVVRMFEGCIEVMWNLWFRLVVVNYKACVNMAWRLYKGCANVVRRFSERGSVDIVSTPVSERSSSPHCSHRMWLCGISCSHNVAIGEKTCRACVCVCICFRCSSFFIWNYHHVVCITNSPPPPCFSRTFHISFYLLISLSFSHFLCLPFFSLSFSVILSLSLSHILCLSVSGFLSLSV